MQKNGTGSILLSVTHRNREPAPLFAPRHAQRLAFALLLLAAIIVIAPVIWIIGVMVKEGAGAMSWQFLTDIPRRGMREGGIGPAIIGTVLLVLGTMVISWPLGVLAAIYLAEYATPNRFTRLVRLAIVNLAGVPSVVYGLFGLGFFVLFCRFGSSILSGSLTLAIMSLPVIITASEEALRSVPASFREVSYSLGATRWQAVRHSVLPYALPGILTGTILAVSRAAGETAPILFTVAALYLPRLPHSIFDQVMALPYHLYVLSTQVPRVTMATRYGTALVLLALVLSLNVAAILIRAHFRRKQRW